MSEQIFRKTSLEKLSSPEQLDQLMQVTRPLKWISLLGCFILIGTAIFWGYWGEILTKVQGKGILLTGGSIYDVVSLGEGRVDTVHVQVNDIVQAGQIVAVLDQPDLEDQIQEARVDLRNLEAERNLVKSLDQKTLNLKMKYLAEHRRTLDETIASNEQRLKFLAEQVEYKKQLLDKKILTLAHYQDAVKEHKDTLQEIMRVKSELNSVSAQEIELESSREKDLITVEYRITQTKEKLRALQDKLHLHSEVTSPHTGKVLEIFKDAGKTIGRGDSLLSLEIDRENGESPMAVIYFPPMEGKKIRLGMNVHVAPSVTKKEEYGYMVSEVFQVSGFPATQRGMLRVLQNEDLVKSLSMGGAPIMVTAKLLFDSQTLSGYKWSSGKGPPMKIQSGTLCDASVVVDKQRPLDLVLPYLKRHVLGIGEERVRTTQ